MSETQPLQDQVGNLIDNQTIKMYSMQDKTEKHVENVKNRRGKRKSSVDIQMPKQKINRKSKKKLNEISDSLKISADDALEPGPVFSSNTTDDNATTQPMLHTEQVYPPLQPSVQSNNNLFYLIAFSVSIAIIAAYFSLFQNQSR
jgi:hypothetical protein